MKPAEGFTILVVDDDAALANALRDFLCKDGHRVEVALSGDEALALHDRTPGIYLALLDLMMPLMDGITLMDKLHERNPDLAVMIMTGYGTIETAVEAMRRGAEDYLTKPIEPDAVRKKIGRLLEMFQLRNRVAELESTSGYRCSTFDSLIFVSPAMQKMVERARTVAQTDASVLLLGETGTGKELLAQAIHGASGRNANPFVAVNCGSLPRDLVESELFGYRRGAFTGAYSDSPGLFASAHGGTVFLDEIGEMPKETQVKLLRVLQVREFRPVGATRSVPVDVRVIAATNRPLAALRSELLREDFYFRIATVVLEILPLRSRAEDLLVLAQHFIRDVSERCDREISLHGSALDLLLRYSFPGNVRELQNLIESVTAISKDDPQVITDRQLRPLLQHAPAGPVSPVLQDTLALDQLERTAIERALELSRGNRTKAASLLGVARETLYRKLRNWKLEVTDS